MDFIGSYLSHNSHLAHNIKIDYQFNIIKWTLSTFTCAKIGPLIHPFIQQFPFHYTISYFHSSHFSKKFTKNSHVLMIGFMTSLNSYIPHASASTCKGT
jgi:hypothetical protein